MRMVWPQQCGYDPENPQIICWLASLWSIGMHKLFCPPTPYREFMICMIMISSWSTVLAVIHLDYIYIPLGSFWANTPLLEFKTNYCVLSNDRLCTSQLSELLVLTRCRGNSKGMNQWGRTLTWCLILLQVDWGSYHSIVGVESLVFRIIRTQLKYIQSIVCTSGWNYQ